MTRLTTHKILPVHKDTSDFDESEWRLRLLVCVIGPCEAVLAHPYTRVRAFSAELMSSSARINDQDATQLARTRVKHLALVIANTINSCLAHSKRKPGTSRDVASFFKKGA